MKLTPFPFPDRTFEKALFLDVIEHLHPRVAVLREIHRVLKDDGRLLVSGPNRENSWLSPGKRDAALRRPEESAGFRVVVRKRR